MLSDLRAVTLIADYFVICEAPSDRQINAITEYIREEVKKAYGMLPLRVEGTGTSGWVLMDYSDILVHVFDPDLREYYDLESLWQAPVVVKMQ